LYTSKFMSTEASTSLTMFSIDSFSSVQCDGSYSIKEARKVLRVVV
jgi:hypothetical protein